MEHTFEQAPGIHGSIGEINQREYDKTTTEAASPVNSTSEESPISIASTPTPTPAPAPPKSPWAKLPVTKEPLEHVTNLASIMAHQEEEAALNSKSSETAIPTSTPNTNTEMPDEEEMIRLAIEASLNEGKDLKDEKPSSLVETSSLSEIDNDMDDDMKLAIQLSMAESNPHSQTIETDFIAFAHTSNSKLASSAPYNNIIAGKAAFGGYEAKVPATANPSTDKVKEASNNHSTSSYALSATMPTVAKAASAHSPTLISREEEEIIAKAIAEADDREQAESLRLAMELQAEEDRQYNKQRVDEVRKASVRSSVRTVTKSVFDTLGMQDEASERQIFGHSDFNDHDEMFGREIQHHAYEDSSHTAVPSPGYSINASKPSMAWSKIDGNNIVGPNNEIRTKHDVTLKNQANADKLLGAKSSLAKNGGELSVSDTAYNSFNRSLKNSMKRTMVKGVERSGTGRAENMNEKTRGGALDGNVRLLITKAINTGIILHCNGAVKEGKEAIVYHAQAGAQGDGFDVAVKVFKRIQEFKNRSAYIDDDPRYHGSKFRNANKRQQVELWTEKEYRNLLRANRAGVAVPTPVMQKENVLFMRFLGEGGWPAAQLREIEIKKRSKKWTVLYVQALVAIRRLFHCARLVHADLSEYNILVCPMSQVENAMDKSDQAKNDLQVVLIDFGQAVERNHCSALDLLRRDLSLVNAFFAKQDIVTLTADASFEFIVEEMVEIEDDTLDAVEEEENGVIKQSETFLKSDEEKEVWRHDIEGWDDAVDLERLERMLRELKASNKTVSVI
eukprot:scaffold1795_cov236-Chaetoceros_neogracile.AAC.7